MYAYQVKDKFLDNQCALLKQRIDRALGHDQTSVTPQGRNVLILVHRKDLKMLSRISIPDRIGSAKVTARLK